MYTEPLTRDEIARVCAWIWYQRDGSKCMPIATDLLERAVKDNLVIELTLEDGKNHWFICGDISNYK